ncbi:bifunctional phosphatase PAP2/diacylglycerol kinase family protein [Streptomyces sp. CB01373]|uniref:bifunctional phosphatase PAP2/diacylglycerol kinase family protein n=1 Tax=Streptomyces sp. CB01373 TaxID=2020325 RepID=UPI000C274DB4|nr:bifunctional phosphatase PAP2/diacylglycerol kinase family protein [Streptomyces sp. CB01373]PJM97623.1 phosphoesterase [Streptomyces sp. CB01373]
MSPDVDLTAAKTGAHALLHRLSALDGRLFEFAAERRWPGAGPVLPRLSRAANHGVLWCAVAAAITASRSPRARRAAARGLVSLSLASLTVNTIGKRSVRRDRPALDPVPLMRRLKRQPFTTSFPSGHAASAAAFATGVALESPAWGAAVAPVAASVALSRVYTGVHFPSDVLAGAALGAGVAFAARALVPTRARTDPPARSRADLPALPGGKGLVLVANRASGTADRASALVDLLPEAEIVECGPEEVRAELEKAADRARVLGVCGGDGTVNTAAEVALCRGLPLAVLPGGTLNHFALDLGVEDARDLARAVEHGHGVRVDVGRFRSGSKRGVFLNTFSLGVYPELVRRRDRLAGRIGTWPAGVLAALKVLRADRHPLRAVVKGHTHPLWLLFAGNGTYHRRGLALGRRLDLTDGNLDVRVVHGGRRPALRLLSAALAGPLTRSPAHAAVQVGRLRLTGVTPGTLLAHDGEVMEVADELWLEKLPEALAVYRPLPGD